MDEYNPQTVFSSIDQHGRYAFLNQPKIVKWNLTRFAESIISLINNDNKKAIEIATETINNFESIYERKWLNMMRDKLGLFGEDIMDKELIMNLLNWMHKNKADYTNTFCFLMNEEFAFSEKFNNADFLVWKKEWKTRLKLNNNNEEKYLKLMRSVNPLLIPRNHKVEEALEAANKNDFIPMKNLIEVLRKPYNNQSNISGFQYTGSISNKKYQTFCGT
jgi:uncharacterized protein YdiU (UPF0061 family)